MITSCLARSIVLSMLLLFFGSNPQLEAAGPSVIVPPQRLILAHYMPWYVAKPTSQVWGWHWTMEHFDPDNVVDEKRQLASHFYPLIGPYDSGDKQVLEYHLLLMKLAGIDGVIVDWYGLQDHFDYPILHRNTQQLVEQLTSLKMKFAICYEDKTIPLLDKAGKLVGNNRVNHATHEITWMAKNWFPLSSYVRLDGKPLLLSFGQSGLTDEQWSESLEQVAASGSAITYISEHHRRSKAMGAFDWPIPKQGLAAISQFEKAAADWPLAIPVAFPRFVDIYEQAKLHDSYGRIEDNQGVTFQRSLVQALKTNQRLIQFASWNDWGEGTQIEPSHEFGYRDLEFTQQARRRHINPRFVPTAKDLRLPAQILERRRLASTPAQTEQLDQIVKLLVAGNLPEARARLQSQH